MEGSLSCLPWLPEEGKELWVWEPYVMWMGAWHHWLRGALPLVSCVVRNRFWSVSIVAIDNTSGSCHADLACTSSHFLL